MNVIDLFSGIGGFSLGLERAGMRTVAFCEIDPFCRRVLAKHWPHVPCYEDVTTLTAKRLRADRVRPVHVICGGFPCQDISYAGAGAGLAGSRSGLWFEYARIIGELLPAYVVVENVTALLSRGLDRVLGDLAEIGYDAQWHCIPASAVGAPHQRDRVWIVANARGEQHEGHRVALSRSIAQELSGAAANAAALFGAEIVGGEQDGDFAGAREVADAGSARLQRPGHVSGSPAGGQEAGQPMLRSGLDGRQWCAEPAVGRVAHGVPSRVDRLRSLGNAVVPQIPEIIGRAIMTTVMANHLGEVTENIR